MIGRVRGLSPAWFHRGALARCPIGARLLLMALLTAADDYGRAPGAPNILRGLFYPDDASVHDVASWLDALMLAREIFPYQHRGQMYLEIGAWAELVRPDRFSGRQHPAPPERAQQADLFGAGNLHLVGATSRPGPSSAARG